MVDSMFTDMGINGLNFVVGESAEDLLKQLSAIKLPIKVITIYAQGSKHYAWIQTSANIKRLNKKEIK